MTHNDYCNIIATKFANNTMIDILAYCSSDVVYISDDKNQVTGKAELEKFFLKRQNALKEVGVECYGYPATVTKSSISGIAVNDRVVALAQFDQYNCTGFLCFKENFFGKIKSLEFHTISDVSFKCDKISKFGISHVPQDAHDAIGYRAIAFGIMNEHVKLSKHIQRYDVFDEMLQSVYDYIMRYLVENFNTGIENVAGYMYATAMTVAVNRKRPGDIQLNFSPVDAVKGKLPKVNGKYQSWINAGFNMGKKLFLGFTEYASIRKPKDEDFVNQLMQSFMDMCLYGSIQANRDMDRNIPC